MPASSPEEIASILVKLLPDDGTPVLNRILRAMISRQTGQIVPREIYFQAIDKLAAEGLIGRMRGQGGQVYWVGNEVPIDNDSTHENSWTEASLMKPAGNYLQEWFPRDFDLPPNTNIIVEDVSRKGPRSGRWSRADFLLVSVTNFGVLPGYHIDVHTFELKKEDSGSILAIHEALAQTRFSNYGHLIWHLPERSKHEARLEEVRKHALDHGIGLILLRDPNDLPTAEVITEPVRKNTSQFAVDGMLDICLSDCSKQIVMGNTNSL